MNIIVVYCYPFNGRDGRRQHAERFVDTYRRFPGHADHTLVVVSNGEPPDHNTTRLFDTLPKVSYFLHDDSGWDIGAYQHVARDIKADLMVFMGGSAYLRREGWLKRIEEVANQYGTKNLFGSMPSGGNGAGVWDHIRTNGFWMHPEVMLGYPVLIHDPGQRYPFEHGSNCLTQWCARTLKVGVAAVTFDGVYGMDKWQNIPEGFRNGQQKALLIGDRLSCPPFYHCY